MSFSFYIDSNFNDFRLSGNTLLLARGIDAIKQQLQTALLTGLGEWYLDTAKGVPYYASTGDLNNNSDPGILGGNYSGAEVGAIMRKIILETPGVVSIKSFSLSQNPDRTISMTSKVVVEQSEISGVGTQQLSIIEVSL